MVVKRLIVFTVSQARPLTCSQAKYSQLASRLALIDQLITGFSSRKRSGRKPAETPTFAECHLTSHKLTKMSKKLVCRLQSDVLGNRQ